MEKLILDDDLEIRVISEKDPLAIEIIPNGIHFLNKQEVRELVKFLNKYLKDENKYSVKPN